jgi:solute carrier family 50 protein (sugar transporter)
MAPITAMRQISDEKSTGKLPLLPYSCMYLCASVWSVYGFLAHNPGIWMANVPGVFTGLFYFQLFCRYCPKDADWLPGKQIHHKVGIAASTVYLGAVSTLLSNEMALWVVGITGNVICIALFASPLAALKTVLKQKSTRSLPFAFGLIGFINCGLWVVYGLAVLHDPFVWFPNLLGFLASAVQMALFARFGVYRYF